MKADPSAQRTLLDLQALDTRADQLRHALATMPELAELATLRTAVGDLDRQRMDQQILVDDLTAEQQKVDADVEAVKARKARDRQRMDAGLITSPKDLERMQQELVSLDRRIGTLEDQEIEVMERLEEAQASLERLTQELHATRERGAELVARRDSRSAQIESDLAAVAAEREPTVSGVPADLLALYDKLRAAKNGLGAAELRARRCGGCMLTLDAGELSAIRAAAPDEVVRCEECQRILVRTDESGL
jgi:predicted  nucleic acid-binding Zn-ribbon protein